MPASGVREIDMANGNKSEPLQTKVDERLRDDARDGTARDGENYGEHEMNTREREQAAQLTDPERRRALRAKYDQRVLPPVPEEKGWHRCWVSTSHGMDTPESREAMGYRYVKMESVRSAGWATDKQAVKDGQYVGCVRWREMVLMELPLDEFIDYMREFHHDLPYEQARGIFEGLDEMDAKARERGGRVTLEEGMEEFRRRIQTPPARQFEV